MTAAQPLNGTSPFQKVFGRGMIEGLRMAGIDNPGEFMQAAKLERIEQGLNGVAKKVLESVPMNEAWSAAKIIGDMTRRTSSNPDFKVVQGCLARLASQGLIREPQRGTFQRVKPRPALTAVSPAAADAESVEEAVLTDVSDAVVVVTPAEPMDRLASLACTLKTLSESMAAAAKELEDVAISVEERIQRIHADSEKLRQLQALLKSIGQ